NHDRTVIRDVDLRTGFFGQRTDGGAALADHVTDLLGVDLHRQHARCEGGQLATRTINGFTHLVEDVQTAFARLRQRHLHDFLGDALDLDVHLQRGNAIDRTGNLEVHVAQVIFI